MPSRSLANANKRRLVIADCVERGWNHQAIYEHLIDRGIGLTMAALTTAILAHDYDRPRYQEVRRVRAVAAKRCRRNQRALAVIHRRIYSNPYLRGIASRR